MLGCQVLDEKIMQASSLSVGDDVPTTQELLENIGEEGVGFSTLEQTLDWALSLVPQIPTYHVELLRRNLSSLHDKNDSHHMLRQIHSLRVLIW